MTWALGPGTQATLRGAGLIWPPAITDGWEVIHCGHLGQVPSSSNECSWVYNKLSHAYLVAASFTCVLSREVFCFATEALKKFHAYIYLSPLFLANCKILQKVCLKLYYPIALRWHAHARKNVVWSLPHLSILTSYPPVLFFFLVQTWLQLILQSLIS